MMKPYWEQDGNKIYQGDAMEVLKSMASESVSMCVTSPPYWGLRDYGVEGQLGLESTPEEYIQHMVEIFRELRRVLRNNGTLWLNLGSSMWGGKGKSGQAWATKNQDRKTIQGSQHQITGMGETRPADGKHDVFKPKDMVPIPWMVAMALQQDGWWLRSAMPWVKRCLSGGAIVYAKTQKGVMPTNLKDLYRLKPETVELWNGKKWTQMKGMTKQPRQGNEIELFLRSGERISCTPEHRWPTELGLKYSSDLKVGDILKRCLLPNDFMVDPKHIPEEMGWFIGTYLADGSRDSNGTIQISSHIKETRRFKRLEIIAKKYHATCHKSQTSENGMTVRLYGNILNAILDTYIAGKTAKNKHLSNNCWERSMGFLYEVLCGYLDGDGHWDAPNERWRLGFCNNDLLAADLRCLSARIGFSLRLKRGTSACNGTKFKTYRGQIRFDLSDKSINSTNFKKLDDNEIIKIGKPRARYYYNIEVEDEPHLFSLASGILTHNSAMPESCSDRPASALEYVFLLTKSQKYYFDMQPIRKKSQDSAKRVIPEGHKSSWKMGKQSGRITDRNGKSDGCPVSGRNFRNTDLFFESLEPPFGAIFAGNELVGLDINPKGFAGAHFATFSPRIPEVAILAGTSERGCCAECGAPWERVVERTKYSDRPNSYPINDARDKCPSSSRGIGAPQQAHIMSISKTTGWKPTCMCKELIEKHGIMKNSIHEIKPCVVLDPFGGAMTTAVVAHKLGRKFVMIELSKKYIDEIGIPRIEKETEQRKLWG